jgi:hypothetical protein
MTRPPRALRHPLLATAAVALPFVLACSAVDCGRTVNKVVPAVREIDPEYNTDPVDCDPPVQMASTKGCAQGVITCGSTVEGNNGGGRARFDDDFYQHMLCTPQRNHYDEAGEAVYRLELPADVLAKVTLISDCAELDVASYRWEEDGRCPNVKHPRAQCEMDTSDRGGSIEIATVNQPENHLVIIDGQDGGVGNFRLKVECRTYR